MPHEWEQGEYAVVAGAVCPIPGCNALVVVYRSPIGAGNEPSEPWQFMCPQCGAEFTLLQNEFFCLSASKNWLCAQVYAA